MFKNYFKTAVRSLIKSWQFSMINIFGLGIGIATCLILFAWINFEFSFDKFYPNADLIYRANVSASLGEQSVNVAVSSDGLYDFLYEISDVNEVCRINNISRDLPVIIKDSKSNTFEQSGVYYVDSTFFDLFEYPFLAGNAKKALRSPESMVITESVARKYFGTENPLNQSLEINNKVFNVEGVVADPPANSTLHFQILCQIYPTLLKQDNRLVGNANYYCFVKVKKSAVLSFIKEKLNAAAAVQMKEMLPGPGDYWQYDFIKLTDIHLYSSSEFEIEPGSNIGKIKIFSAVAVLVLFMAMLNYVNLSSAQAVNRAKEIGVRKTVGAFRSQLILQFMIESLLSCFLSLAIAILFSLLFLPIFNQISGQNLMLVHFSDPLFIGSVITIIILIGLLSGIYPALVVTSYKLDNVLKGSLDVSHKGSLVKKILVGTQYSIGMALVFCSIVLYQQLEFVQSKPLGYERQGVIAITIDKASRNLVDVLKIELEKTGVVLSSSMGVSPARIVYGNSFSLNERDAEKILVRSVPGDESYLSTLNIQLIAGRNFQKSEKQEFDSTGKAIGKVSLIVNEELADRLMFKPSEILDKEVTFSGSEGVIVGVVKNFNFASLHNAIEPMVLVYWPHNVSTFLVRIPGTGINNSLNSIKNTYTSIINHRPFSYSFLDEEFRNLYKDEEQLGLTMLVFTFLSFLIIVLGLSSLIAFAVTQRMKEISIRKVLGVSVTQIVILLSSQFTAILVMSVLVSMPVSYWLMDSWLSHFAYRIEIGIAPFVISILTGAVIYFGIIIAYSLRTLHGNIAEILRGE